MGIVPLILFISLEFTQEHIFSGNGVLGRSHVQGLLRAGYSVHVICGVPSLRHGGEEEGKSELEAWEPTVEEAGQREFAGLYSQEQERSSSYPVKAGSLFLMKVPVPVAKWKRLDRAGPWADWATNAVVGLQRSGSWKGVLDSAMQQPSTRVLYVDWTGALVWHRLLKAHNVLHGPKVAYLNFRVFASAVAITDHNSNFSGGLEGELPPSIDGAGEDSPRSFESLSPLSDFHFYARLETLAMQWATTTVALCPSDAESLKKHALVGGEGTGGELKTPIKVLLPCLRSAVNELSIRWASASEEGGSVSQGSWAKGRRYLVCCVRLVPDKNAALFVTLVERLAATLRQLQIIPFLCGAAADQAYAEKVKKDLRRVFPESVIEENFLSAEAMATIFQQTVLNVHPSLYDAYGMTIVEAAAFEAPSLVHCVTPTDLNEECQSPVGASELLLPTKGELFPADLSSGVTDSVVQQVELALRQALDGGCVVDQTPSTATEGCGASMPRLAEVGRRAREKALSWTEAASTRQLMELIKLDPAHQ